VTKIGLRSIEMETIDSRITIPNAIADDATIVNFSERKRRSDSQPSQGMELRFALEAPLSPDQVSDLLDYMRAEVAERSELQEPVVSVEQQGDGSLSLLCFAVVSLHEWQPYLILREQLLLRIQQIVDVVKKSRVIVGVSYDTTAEQLQQIPELVRSVVNGDPDFKLRSCRLMAISEFSYDFVFDFRTTHASYRAFKDGINRMNQQLLSSLEAEGIEIPFPTAVEIQKHS
jgi:MscS family membrane protein